MAVLKVVQSVFIAVNSAKVMAEPQVTEERFAAVKEDGTPALLSQRMKIATVGIPVEAIAPVVSTPLW